MEDLAVVLKLLLIMVGLPVGAGVAMRDGMLLHPLRRLFERVPQALHKPSFECGYCMVSVWGIAPACLVAFLPFAWYMIPIIALSAVGWMAILDLENR